MGQLFSTSRKVVLLHGQTQVTYPVPSNNTDLYDLHADLCRKFKLETSAIISGFIVDHENGGPVCPIRLIAALKGGERCRLVVLQHAVEDLLQLPVPPARLDRDQILNLMVSWKMLKEGTAEQRMFSFEKLCSALSDKGFAYIAVQAGQSEIVRNAVKAAKDFFADPLESKVRNKVSFPRSKFVGYSKQGKREFFQVRKVGSHYRFPWPEDEQGTSDFASAIRVLYEELSQCSRYLLENLCPLLQLDANEIRQMLDSQDDGHLENERNDKSDDVAASDFFVGSDVLRLYQYHRPLGEAPPGIANAATGIHADMGLLTVAPCANLPGLVMLSPDACRWLDVEASLYAVMDDDKLESLTMEEHPREELSLPHCDLHVESSGAPGDLKELEHKFFVVFAGETLGNLSRGKIRAPLHYVDEYVIGRPRISMPFFTRARPDSKIRRIQHSSHCNEVSVASFMEDVVLTSRPWIKPRPPPNFVVDFIRKRQGKQDHVRTSFKSDY
mmetsp:Transcript_52059/g.161894  ORF Transcript_52059/g.161894 Transcript_52059/m.161894 type:complete len:499 (-) Transcript_52059:90-1586(-)